MGSMGLMRRMGLMRNVWAPPSSFFIFTSSFPHPPPHYRPDNRNNARDDQAESPAEFVAVEVRKKAAEHWRHPRRERAAGVPSRIHQSGRGPAIGAPEFHDRRPESAFAHSDPRRCSRERDDNNQRL